MWNFYFLESWVRDKERTLRAAVSRPVVSVPVRLPAGVRRGRPLFSNGQQDANPCASAWLAVDCK